MLLTPIMTPSPLHVSQKSGSNLFNQNNEQTKEIWVHLFLSGWRGCLLSTFDVLAGNEGTKKSSQTADIYMASSHTLRQKYTHTQIQTVSPQKSQIVFFLTANTNCYSVAPGCGSHVASSNSFSSEGDCGGRGRGDGTMLSRAEQYRVLYSAITLA